MGYIVCQGYINIYKWANLKYFSNLSVLKSLFTYFVGMYLGHVQKCYFCAFFYVYSFIVNIIKLIIESF